MALLSSDGRLHQFQGVVVIKSPLNMKDLILRFLLLLKLQLRYGAGISRGISEEFQLLFMLE